MFPEVDTAGNCVDCGKARVVGDFPKCPHEPVRVDPRKTDFYQDSIPGGMVIENGVPEPVRVYSHAEARALREQHGFRIKEKFSPMPGTDKDPAGIPNPRGYMDPYTLEAAKTLLLRQQGFEPEKVLVIKEDGPSEGEEQTLQDVTGAGPGFSVPGVD